MSLTRKRYVIFATKVNEFEKILELLKTARAKFSATCTKIKMENVPCIGARVSEVCSEHTIYILRCPNTYKLKIYIVESVLQKLPSFEEVCPWNFKW